MLGKAAWQTMVETMQKTTKGPLRNHHARRHGGDLQRPGLPERQLCARTC
jgi:hypothetical protein